MTTQNTQMTYELGKSYTTFDGLKARVICTDRVNKKTNGEKEMIVLATNEVGHEVAHFLKKDGCTWTGMQYLVSEWVEPLDFDWNCLPAWKNTAICFDPFSKCWTACENIPTLVCGSYAYSGGFTLIPPDYAPKNFNGRWEDSIHINPNITKKE